MDTIETVLANTFLTIIVLFLLYLLWHYGRPK
jgi:hypothetical protein